jgi:hypothetical protein
MELEERVPDQSKGSADRRAHTRFTVDEAARLLFVEHGLEATCRVLDLSVEGCRLFTSQRIPRGARLDVEVTFIINGMPLRLQGLIQRTGSEHEAGIRFVNVSSRRKELLAEVISEMEAAEAARAVAQGAAELAGNQASALAGAHLPGEISATMPSASLAFQLAALPLAGEAPGGAERRLHPRHAADTSVALFFSNSGVRLIGSILDLSMSGCRIHTEARFPAEIQTRVETEFRLGGMPFRLSGVVQALHDRHHAGIRFLNLSLSNRQQVEELIENIREMRER